MIIFAHCAGTVMSTRHKHIMTQMHFYSNLPALASLAFFDLKKNVMHPGMCEPDSSLAGLRFKGLRPLALFSYECRNPRGNPYDGLVLYTTISTCKIFPLDGLGDSPGWLVFKLGTI